MLDQLIKMIQKWRADKSKMKHCNTKLVQIGQVIFNVKNKDLENENRLENLKELLRAMQDYDNLQSFLEHVALATSIDQEWEGAKINMTMHLLRVQSLKFFGWEGLFPHQNHQKKKVILLQKKEDLHMQGSLERRRGIFILQ